MIEVVKEGRVPRCTQRYDDGRGATFQCDHFKDHFGPHQVAVSTIECLRWPSEDCVEEAVLSEQFDRMTDAEVEADLLDEETGVTKEVLQQWSTGVGVFAKAMVKARREIDALKAERAETNKAYDAIFWAVPEHLPLAAKVERLMEAYSALEDKNFFLAVELAHLSNPPSSPRTISPAALKETFARLGNQEPRKVVRGRHLNIDQDGVVHCVCCDKSP